MGLAVAAPAFAASGPGNRFGRLTAGRYEYWGTTHLEASLLRVRTQSGAATIEANTLKVVVRFPYDYLRATATTYDLRVYDVSSGWTAVIVHSGSGTNRHADVTFTYGLPLEPTSNVGLGTAPLAFKAHRGTLGIAQPIISFKRPLAAEIHAPEFPSTAGGFIYFDP